MDAIECLKTRRSVRHYRPDPIPDELLEEIVDCGRLAPSGRNEQPWEFVVITDRKRLEGLSDLTDYGKHIAHAAACIVVFCRDTKYYLEDGSAATTQLALAAWAHGIGSCWVSGDKRPYAEAVREYCGLPEGYRLISLLPLGYPEEVPTKPKRPLEEVLHRDRFSR